MLENGRSGTDVVLLSIAYIHQVAIFQDDNDLLRRIAFVETKDGSYLNGFNNSGGIWAVDEDTFLSTQINNNSKSSLFQKYERIRLLFGIEWKAVQWSELNKPLYSALAARLVLFFVPENIPSSEAVPAQAKFWKDHYNTEGSVRDFIRATIELKGTCGPLVYV